jgi:hypothetical protein
MNSSKWLSVGVVGLALLFGTAQAETATELKTQQQIQQQTHERTGPAENQPASAAQKKMYQKKYEHQYKYDKKLNKTENGSRATEMGMQGSGDSSNRSPQSVNRSGGGGKH